MGWPRRRTAWCTGTSSGTSKAKPQQPKQPPWQAPRSPSSNSSRQQPTLNSNNSSSSNSNLPMSLLNLAILGHLLHTQLRPPTLHRIQGYLPNTNLTFHFSFCTFDIYD